MEDRIANPDAAGLWEYALAAGDELVLWYLGTAAVRGEQDDEVQRQQALVVVLIAAALHDRGAAAGLGGTDLAAVELTAVHGALDHHAGPVVDAAPAAAGLGGEQREHLLAAHGTPAFDAVRTAALRVLAAHIGDGGGLLADRAAALAAEGRARRLRQLEYGVDGQS